jgi:hypothetical protein
VTLALVGGRVNTVEVFPKLVPRITYTRCQRIGEGCRWHATPVVAEAQLLAIRAQGPTKPGLEPPEPPTDVALEDVIGLCFLLVERCENPPESRALPAAERPSLLDEPREMDLEVAARSCITRDVTQPPAKLLGEIVAEVRAKGALPTPKPPKSDAKVVQRLVIGGILQPITRGCGVREVAESHESDRSVGGVAKVVYARGHWGRMDRKRTFRGGE